METPFPHIFSPMKIGSCEIPNRLVVPAMVVNMNPDKTATERYIRYHEEKARGGWGLIITEDYLTSEHAGGYPYIAGLYDESQIPSHRALTDRIHQYDTKIFCQIYHAGRQANRGANGGAQPVSCSPIPDAWNKDIPRELTVDEIQQIVRDFGRTAANVVKAGFDGLEIHAAHGYLIHEFLSPNSNKRIDEYGGCYVNRTRFLREIMEEVRKAVGPDFPISVRLSAAEFADGGRSMFESRQIIRDIETWGADVLHLSFSMYGTRASQGIVSSYFQNHGWNVRFAEEAKSLVKIPVITVGRIQEPWMAEDIIASGKADFVGMARASLTDPHLPEKARRGETEDIRQCIGCLQGCTASTHMGVPVHCLVNPEVGFEAVDDLSPAAVKKKVMVVGGGVAGMEAARAAAMKGHEVHLYERTGELGGQFLTAAYPPFKGEFATLPYWQCRQLAKLGVRIHLNTEVTKELVAAEKPDKVILATGAKPYLPELPGIHGPNVVIAEDVLRGRAAAGMNVVVAGGGLIGSETAGYLCVQCKQHVTMLAKHEDIAREMEGGIRDDLKDLLNKYFVEIRTESRLAGVTEQGALVQEGGRTFLIPCDTVVLAIGTRANNSLAAELEGVCETVVVGDAIKPRMAVKAVREGFVAGLNA